MFTKIRGKRLFRVNYEYLFATQPVAMQTYYEHEHVLQGINN